MGGAQTYLWRLLERAKQNGDSVIVMANEQGWLSEKTKQLGFEFIANPYFKNSFNPLNMVRAVFSVREKIKEFNPDVVHCNSGGGGFFGRLASVGLPVKIIFTAHGWSFTDGTPFVRKTIARIAEMAMVPFTDNILCVSHNDARLAKKYLFGVSKKMQVIHNGVPIPEVFATPGMSDTIQLLFAGRLTRPKLPMAILAALAQLPFEMKSQFKLRIAGHGHQEQILHQFSQEQGLVGQVIIGAVPTEQMANEYLVADLFLLPTEWEGFPMTIVEAMAAGLPVVASAVGGIPEAVDDTVGALLHRGDEAAELEILFKKIAQDPTWLTQRGNAAHSRAAAEFSADQMCDKVWEVYKS